MKETKVDISEVYAFFQCPECNNTTKVSFTNIINVGNPICDVCDNDMELVQNEGVILT